MKRIIYFIFFIIVIASVSANDDFVRIDNVPEIPSSVLITVLFFSFLFPTNLNMF